MKTSFNLIRAAGARGISASDFVPGSAAVKQTLQFLLRHSHKPIDVDDLVAASKLSRRGLYNAFVRHTGQSPGRRLRRIRIERARQLLATSDWSMEVIAEMCGYTSANSFWVAFRRDTGTTPGRYRQKFARPGYRRAESGVFPMRSSGNRPQKLHSFLRKREKNRHRRAGSV